MVVKGSHENEVILGGGSARGANPSRCSNANPLATAQKQISTDSGLSASGKTNRSEGMCWNNARTLSWTDLFNDVPPLRTTKSIASIPPTCLTTVSVTFATIRVNIGCRAMDTSSAVSLMGLNADPGNSIAASGLVERAILAFSTLRLTLNFVLSEADSYQRCTAASDLDKRLWRIASSIREPASGNPS